MSRARGRQERKGKRKGGKREEIKQKGDRIRGGEGQEDLSPGRRGRGEKSGEEGRERNSADPEERA